MEWLSGTRVYRGAVVLLMLMCLAGPCTAQSKRPWKKRWWITAGLLAVANIADIHSSRGLAEGNPLLRNSRGGIDLQKSVLIKSAASGGFLLLQRILIKRMPESHLEKPFAITNTLAAGAVAVTAARNYRIPRAPSPEGAAR
jgi:hypothetical protein